MLSPLVSIRTFVLAGMLGIPALLGGCCASQSVCAPVAPTCTPVAGGAAVAYQAASVPQKTLAVVPANPAAEERVARAKAAVTAAVAENKRAEDGSVESKPAVPAKAGGSAKLDPYQRPENFSLAYPGLSSSELANYGVGNHYDVAVPEFAETSPLE